MNLARRFLPFLMLAVFISACSGGSNNGGVVLTSVPTEAPAPTVSNPPPVATANTPPRPAPQNDYDPSRFTYSLEPVGSGFSEPDLITFAPDGSGRLYVLEKPGSIRLMDGSLFLDIRDRVKSPPVSSYDREQGLLGLAFHPDFARNGFFFIHYNDKAGVHVISRLKTGANGRGDPASEKVLIRQDQPETNFNGGMLTFGADGYLYIGLGTGGTDRKLQDEATNLNSLLGKILRIDVNNGDPYAIPQDNPFRNRAGARPEVWAYGLRNPWRFSFDRATGDLYIGGPGQFRREWINFQAAGTPAGQNFGWPVLEGTLCYEGNNCNRTGLSLPIIERNTYDNGNCVIIGGVVYRGTKQAGLKGAYLYSDFCSGRVWGASRSSTGAWTSTELLLVGGQVSSFGEGEDGEVYIADIQRGNIYHIISRPR
jgi:glucose/arabinose dehydrogenase